MKISDFVILISAFSGLLALCIPLMVKIVEDRTSAKIDKRIEKHLTAMSERIIKNEARIDSNRELFEEKVDNLAEKAASDKADFKDRVKEIAEYLYNRAR